MNVVQGEKTDGRQLDILLDAVVTIIKYKKIANFHIIYIKVFSDVTVYYLIVSTDDVIKTNKNYTAFTELRRFI